MVQALLAGSFLTWLAASLLSFLLLASAGDVSLATAVVALDIFPFVVGWCLDVAAGAKPGGMILVNTDRSPANLTLKGDFQVRSFSADKLARKILGRPIMNTALLGAFAAMTGELSLDAALKAVRSKFPGALGQKNARVVERSYHLNFA